MNKHLLRVAIGSILTSALLSVAVAGDPPKKSAPAPAAHAAAPAAQNHPAAGGGGAAAGAGGGAGHAVTTTSAAHPAAVTTSGAAHAGTTTAGAAHPSTGAAAGAAGARPGVTGAGAHGANAFGGHPAPANSHEMHAANGAAVRTRADGTRSDVHDPAHGMDIHHGLNGDRRVAVERADHSRVFAERGGRGYVQHPYMFHGHEFGHRTYFAHGRAYDHFYGRYGWHGRYYDVYAPARYYPYGFYGYAYAPWPAPVAYAWAPAPWYTPYSAYYAYYPAYPAPAFWLTDFVFAASLAAAYEAGAKAGAQGASLVPDAPALMLAAWLTDWWMPTAQAASAGPALTPEIKQQVNDEIKAMLQEEGAEAQANVAKKDLDPSAGSVMKLLGDNRPHVFVAGTDIDAVAGTGECALSQGDVVRVSAPPAGDAETIGATVLASKGAKECAANTAVTVGLSDLQDMHNHMRESIDDGLAELQKKQGTNGLPAAPADASGAAVPASFTADAPPPDANAGSDIAQQLKQADSSEKEVLSEVSSTPAGAAPDASAQVNISVGQSIDTVTAALGNPLRIIDLGAKKIYSYKDMKVVFMNGKVSDVQ